MSEPEPRRGRAHDAKGAREAILNAAEEVFAQHGFDGARIAAIAEVSGYNSSLIFQYFDDKIGLYAEVVGRTVRQFDGMRAQLLATTHEDDIASNAHTFKTLLTIAVSAFFDYLVEHPRFMRILLWEMAEGWQTFAKIVSQRERENIVQIRPILSKAQDTGLLRSGFDPIIQFLMAVYFCQHYLAFLPLYQGLLPGEDVSSAAALARAREYIVDFVVHGMMVDPAETKP